MESDQSPNHSIANPSADRKPNTLTDARSITSPVTEPHALAHPDAYPCSQHPQPYTSQRHSVADFIADQCHFVTDQCHLVTDQCHLVTDQCHSVADQCHSSADQRHYFCADAIADTIADTWADGFAHGKANDPADGEANHYAHSGADYGTDGRPGSRPNRISHGCTIYSKTVRVSSVPSEPHGTDRSASAEPSSTAASAASDFCEDAGSARHSVRIRRTVLDERVRDWYQIMHRMQHAV